MSDTHTNPIDRPAPGGRPSTGHREEFTVRIPKPGGGGPVRAAIKTTEFWMTVILVVFVLLAAYVDGDALPRADGWRFATWAVMAYVISRGLAKLGNRSDATREIGRP
ncbi:MAG TPA: hypothetical protein VM324_01515 [Egibacteraceae bacterium]|jgi:hypothetical protein|nr:hypothetical protein [Egibacteraceae bacterium]